MEYLFDIAYRDALGMLTVQENPVFWLAQRNRGRREKMTEIDQGFALQQKRRRTIEEAAQRKKASSQGESLREVFIFTIPGQFI